MGKTRRNGTLITMAAAAPAAAIGRGPRPVSHWLPSSVRANTGSGMTIHRRADRPACDAEVRARGERVRVDHPGFRRSATFSRGGAPRPGHTDRTRIRVTPSLRRPGVTRLWATISYDECGWKSRTRTRTAPLSLPVPRNTRPGGHDGPGGPGHVHPGGLDQDGPGAPGHDGPGQGPKDSGQGGPGHHAPGGGQGNAPKLPGASGGDPATGGQGGNRAPRMAIGRRVVEPSARSSDSRH